MENSEEQAQSAQRPHSHQLLGAGTATLCYRKPEKE